MGTRLLIFSLVLQRHNRLQDHQTATRSDSHMGPFLLSLPTKKSHLAPYFFLYRGSPRLRSSKQIHFPPSIPESTNSAEDLPEVHHVTQQIPWKWIHAPAALALAV